MDDIKLETPIQWEFDDTNTCSTDDFWYDLFEGGYIKPEKLIVSDAQREAVKKAIELLEDFREGLEEAGITELI